MFTKAPLVPWSGPIDPDHAREIVEKELSKSSYEEKVDYIHELWLRLQEYLSQASQSTALPREVLLTVFALFMVALIVLVVMLLRRSSQWAVKRYQGEALLGLDTSLSFKEVLAKARSAQEAGDARTATLQAMRALVLNLNERNLIELHDGLTAHEAAVHASEFFPQVKDRLFSGADLFDQAAYSDKEISLDASAQLILLAGYLEESTPVRSEHVTA